MWVIDLAVMLTLGALLLTPYVLYPVLLKLMPRVKRTPRAEHAEPPRTVSIVIAAHNEEARIVKKLENTLGLSFPRERVEILVGSDGSEDATERLARRFVEQGVEVVSWPQRSGKTFALKSLLTRVRGEVVVFTDVSAELSRDVLTKLMAALEDPDVGVAVARYVCKGSRDDGESAYFRGETRLKQLEAERDMLLGGHGACYAIRRELIADFPVDTIHDDFVIPMLARASGARIVYVTDALVRDTPSGEPRVVFHRTARMAQGNLQMLWRHRALLSPSRGRVALSLWAHKLLKTLGPVWISLLLGYVAVRAIDAPFHRWLFLSMLMGGVATALSVFAVMNEKRVPFPGSLLAYGFVAQAACAFGIWRYVSGAETVRWKRAPENDPIGLSRPALPPTSVRLVKRSLDVVGALLMLVLLSPVMLLVAIAVRLESRGPSVYRQERQSYDEHGRKVPFTMLKFRSMRLDAEANGRAVWATEHDPRVTRVGALLRKTRLDELPQLWNVLAGEMSLVGPRPERPEIVEKLDEEIPGYSERLLACKPGITGWAQIHTGYDTSLDSVRRKIMFDFAYAAHLYNLRSYLTMEARVALRTLSVMAFGKGAR